jgi:hypothetical protein
MPSSPRSSFCGRLACGSSASPEPLRIARTSWIRRRPCRSGRSAKAGSPEAKVLLLERVILASAAADPARHLMASRRVVDVGSLLGALDRPLADPYFQYHLLPFGYRRELQVLCGDRRDARALLTWSWKDNGEAPSPSQLCLLDALAQHVTAGIARAGVRAALASPQGSEIGLLVLDERGQIELANGGVERWLSAEKPPSPSCPIRRPAPFFAPVAIVFLAPPPRHGR